MTSSSSNLKITRFYDNKMKQAEIDVKRDYVASLSDLKSNSKPLINTLSIVAGEYRKYGRTITEVIEAHILQAAPAHKLPCLYLVDSIIKNIGAPYIDYLSRCIVKMFVTAFKEGDEGVRKLLFKLRCTWKDIFSAEKLRDLDSCVREIDPNWPKFEAETGPTVHVNPSFLKNKVAEAKTAVNKSKEKEVLLAAKKLEEEKAALEKAQRDFEEKKKRFELQMQLQEQKQRLLEETKAAAESSSMPAIVKGVPSDSPVVSPLKHVKEKRRMEKAPKHAMIEQQVEQVKATTKRTARKSIANAPSTMPQTLKKGTRIPKISAGVEKPRPEVPVKRPRDSDGETDKQSSKRVVPPLPSSTQPPGNNTPHTRDSGSDMSVDSGEEADALRDARPPTAAAAAPIPQRPPPPSSAAHYRIQPGVQEATVPVASPEQHFIRPPPPTIAPVSAVIPPRPKAPEPIVAPRPQQQHPPRPPPPQAIPIRPPAPADFSTAPPAAAPPPEQYGPAGYGPAAGGGSPQPKDKGKITIIAPLKLPGDDDMVRPQPGPPSLPPAGRPPPDRGPPPRYPTMDDPRDPRGGPPPEDPRTREYLAMGRGVSPDYGRDRSPAAPPPSGGDWSRGSMERVDPRGGLDGRNPPRGGSMERAPRGSSLERARPDHPHRGEDPGDEMGAHPPGNMKWRDRGPMRGGAKGRRGGRGERADSPGDRKYYGVNIKDVKAVPQKALPEILMFDKDPAPVEKNFTIDRRPKERNAADDDPTFLGFNDKNNPGHWSNRPPPRDDYHPPPPEPRLGRGVPRHPRPPDLPHRYLIRQDYTPAQVNRLFRVAEQDFNDDVIDAPEFKALRDDITYCFPGYRFPRPNRAPSVPPPGPIARGPPIIRGPGPRPRFTNPTARIEAPVKRVPPPAPRHVDAASIFEQLIQSGLVKKPPPFKLTFKYIMNLNKDTLIDQIYSGTPCTNCGRRFDDEEVKNFNVHLDWHFRVNRMTKDGGIPRQWYIDRDVWTVSGPKFEDTTPVIGPPPGTNEGSGGEEEIWNPEEEEFSGLKRCVMKTGDNEGCAVCSDRLQQEFNQRDDDWYFLNAVRRSDDKVCHAHCLQEGPEEGNVTAALEATMNESVMDSVDGSDRSRSESQDLSLTPTPTTPAPPSAKELDLIATLEKVKSVMLVGAAKAVDPVLEPEKMETEEPLQQPAQPEPKAEEVKPEPEVKVEMEPVPSTMVEPVTPPSVEPPTVEPEPEAPVLEVKEEAPAVPMTPEEAKAAEEKRKHDIAAEVAEAIMALK